MITPNSPIVGYVKVGFTEPPSVTRREDLDRYVTELNRLCKLANLDVRILYAQGWHETAGFSAQSRWWTERLNPAGLGVTGDPVQNEASPTFASGQDAARAQVVHMLAYTGAASVGARSVLNDYRRLDLRYDAVIEAGFAGTVRVLSDLGRGKWAADPDYADLVADRANAIFSEEPMTDATFGNVTHPPFQDRTIPNANNWAWNDLGQRNPLGCCQHSMVGGLVGTDGWFRGGGGGAGLTDYGIGGSTDGNLDGVIYRWNDPRGRRAPWANGGSDGLEGDGPLFVRTLGIDAINRDLVSIERSDGGDTTTPMSPKQFESICALSAYWFDQAKVPANVFPLNPSVGVVTHLLHKEFATKDCPHPPVYNRIDEIQTRIRAILAAGQKAEGEPTPPKPNHGDWEPYSLSGLQSRYGTFPVTQADGTEQTSRWHDNGSIPNAWVARARKEGHTRAGTIPKPLRGFIAIDKDGIEQMVVMFDGRGNQNWTLYRPAREVAWRWLQ
jgi:hypothetical protein